MMHRSRIFHCVGITPLVGRLLIALCYLSLAGLVRAQSVRVTLLLDTNQISLGQSTLLHAYAQILPALRPATSQIFSWYVDLLNEQPALASANFSALLRPASDQDPRTSSSGTTVGANRRGIYDTFLNLPGAGRDLPVELFSVPITGLAEGEASFTVAPGTTVPDLTSDFLVAPEGGGDPLTGAEYDSATAVLKIVRSSLTPGPLHIAATNLPAGKTRVTLTFPAQPNGNQYVESLDSLGSGQVWRTLPGAPHNSGLVSETNTISSRFYRLRLVAP